MHKITFPMQLRSDFREPYDHWFYTDPTLPVFQRNSTSGLDRQTMLQQLSTWGFLTPDFGTVEELYENLLTFTYPVDALKQEVVVFTSLTKHCGEGKLLMTFDEALRNYPTTFAERYIKPMVTALKGRADVSIGVSYRYLRIGSKSFWLEYTSTTDWRSNCGNVAVKKLPCDLIDLPYIPAYPLYAIDFVVGPGIIGPILYALDFNIAPSITETGVLEEMTPFEVCEELTTAWHQFSI